MSGARFEREVRLAFSADALWADIQLQAAQDARATRDRLIAEGRFPRAFTTLVNGIEGAAEETIRPGGAIVYEGQVLGPAVAFALAFLRDRSPSRRTRQYAKHSTPDRYADSFMVAISRGSADGRPIPASRFSADAVSADATGAFIYNRLPFARKVDVQLEGGRKLSFSSPPGLFADAARAVRSRWPTLNASRLYTVQHPAAERTSAGRRLEYPALEIRLARA